MAFCQGYKQGFHSQAKRVKVLYTGSILYLNFIGSSHFDNKCYRHIRDGALTASSKPASLTSSCCHFNHLGLFQEVEKGSDLSSKTVSSETTYPCIFN